MQKFVVNISAWQKWIELEKAGNPGFLHQLFELFLETLPHQVGELEKAILVQDRTRIHLASHTLKSSCANLGFEFLAEEFARIEMANKDLDRPLPKALNPVLYEAYQFALVQVTEELRKGKSRAG